MSKQIGPDIPPAILAGRSTDWELHTPISVYDQLTLVGDADKGAKKQAVDRLLSLGLEVIYPAIENAIRDDSHADLRNGAMEVLVKFGTAALPKLFALLEDENEEVRNFATVMLGEIGSSAAVGPLIKALDDSDSNVQHGAAEALGKLHDESAFEPLVKLLDDGFWHQNAAIYALGEMRAVKALPQLLHLLEDKILLEPVIGALGKIGDERALAPLLVIMDSLSGRETAVAERAIEAIRRQAV